MTTTKTYSLAIKEIMRKIIIFINMGVKKKSYNPSRFQTPTWIVKSVICELSPDQNNYIYEYTKEKPMVSKVTNTKKHQEFLKV